MDIRKIWIEEGCIACNLCEDLAPEIFEVPAGENCRVRPDALTKLTAPGSEDGDLHSRTREAEESCPVEVIQVETGSSDPT